MSPSPLRRARPLFLVAVGSVGVCVGLAFFTANYAGATSYLSNDPKACINCHVMNEEYDAWMKGAHHAQSCNDCHVPVDLIGKYATKIEHGWRHSKGFTLQDFHEPIRITQSSLDVVQANCVRCHDSLVSGISAAHVADGETEFGCVHCHGGVGHGPMR